VYTAVYHHLLQHRHTKTLSIDTILKPSGSAYDLAINGTELAATPNEVNTLIATIENKYTPETLEHAVAHWFEM
jgi:hypothetical protein